MTKIEKLHLAYCPFYHREAKFLYSTLVTVRSNSVVLIFLVELILNTPRFTGSAIT